MRAEHNTHSLPSFPIYSLAFLSEDKLVVGGGGGSSKTGVKNKLKLLSIPDYAHLDPLSEYEVEVGEDAPMSIAVDTKDSRIVCGINSTEVELKKGQNQNCRAFSIKDNEFNLIGSASTLNADVEEFQRVTSLSPGCTLVAAAGFHDLVTLSYPSLTPAAKSVHTEHEIYDVAFSTKMLVVATTNNLFVYDIPAAGVPNGTPSPVRETRSRRRQKSKPKIESLSELELLRTVDRPSLPGASAGAGVFRVVRFHPENSHVLYTVQNATLAKPGSRKNRMPPKQGYVCRWDTETWEVTKIRKIGERGITCFDVSSNGKYLAYGAADCSIGVLDATTLAPLLSVLSVHELSPTAIRFNPSATLLVSGSPDTSIRAVQIPDSLAGTTWTTMSVILTILVLLVSILLAFYFSTAVRS